MWNTQSTSDSRPSIGSSGINSGLVAGSRSGSFHEHDPEISGGIYRVIRVVDVLSVDGVLAVEDLHIESRRVVGEGENATEPTKLPELLSNIGRHDLRIIGGRTEFVSTNKPLGLLGFCSQQPDTRSGNGEGTPRAGDRT